MDDRLAGRPDPAGRTYEVTEHYRGVRLDRFLQAMIPRLSRRRIQRAIRQRVETSWHPAPRPSLRALPGGRVLVRFVEVPEPEAGPAPRILHEDGSILVVEKPAGLLVHPTHTSRRNNLVHLLRAARPGGRIALAHRLDRETSGLLLVARSVEASRRLADQFASGRVRKGYRALVHGSLGPDAGSFDRPLGVERRLDVLFRRSERGERPRPARTDFRVLRRTGRFTLVDAFPRTGRRHQIRAHFADAGHPIVGDKLYATDPRFFLRLLREGPGAGTEAVLLSPRQLLHARSLSFEHPGTGARVRFVSPLPADFREVLDRLAPAAGQSEGRGAAESRMSDWPGSRER